MQQKYEVLGVIGEGAYGIVYKCKNKETKEFVAIKKFKETEEPIVKKTMQRELKVLQILKHENVVEFKEAFKRKHNLFLVFEYVERNLLEVLQEKKDGLEPHLIKRLIYQLCKAIKYLHDQNIIHRDIKPENLLVNNDNQLKLCDFGFARKVSNTSNESLTDYVATRWYRSPELLITNGFYGTEVDYWAIGCIMGELVDGNPLFPGDNETDQLHCIQKVLGNLPEDQVNMFYNNPLYNGKSLLNVNKPERLERRYLGKLPKIAIDLMKGLLELDPKKRLSGSNVFSHPYFEDLVSKEANMVKHDKLPPPISTSQRANVKTADQPTTINTTNINIINYNTYNSTLSPPETQLLNPIAVTSNGSFLQPKEKTPKKPLQIVKEYNCNTNQLNQPKQLASNSGNNSSSQELNPYTTALNFNQNINMQDNIGAMASLTGYKTFYNKNDKYNFGINTKFASNTNTNNGNYNITTVKPTQVPVFSNRNQNDVIEEEAEYKNLNEELKKKKLKAINPLLKTNSNIKQLSMLYNNNPKHSKNNNMNLIANCSSYGPSFSKPKKIELPSLSKLSTYQVKKDKTITYHKYK